MVNGKGLLGYLGESFQRKGAVVFVGNLEKNSSP